MKPDAVAIESIEYIFTWRATITSNVRFAMVSLAHGRQEIRKLERNIKHASLERQSKAMAFM